MSGRAEEAVWRGRRVLVTGARGFIGSRLVHRLVAEGAEVRSLVRLRSGSLLPGEACRAPARVEYFEGDLGDAAAIRGVCRGIDSVFHLAGYAHAEDSLSPTGDEIHYRTTRVGTRNLLEEARASDVKRFVFVSTVKVMGEGGDVCLNEESVVRPATAYAREKLEAERLVLADGKAAGRHSVVVRLPLVYGPTARGNIPRMIDAIARGRFPPWPETGNRRSMVHVEDVVSALLLVGLRPIARGQVYCVADGRTYSTHQLYMAIRRGLGLPDPRWFPPIHLLRFMAVLGDVTGVLVRRRLPFNTGVLTKLTGSAWYSADKIRRDLGFEAQHHLLDDLPDAIRGTVRVRDR